MVFKNYTRTSINWQLTTTKLGRLSHTQLKNSSKIWTIELFILKVATKTSCHLPYLSNILKLSRIYEQYLIEIELYTLTVVSNRALFVTFITSCLIWNYSGSCGSQTFRIAQENKCRIFYQCQLLVFLSASNFLFILQNL